MKKVVKKNKAVVKKMSKPQGPSKFLIGALIFSWTLLAVVLAFRHKLFDESEDLSSTGPLQVVHQAKQSVEDTIKVKIDQKLNGGR